MSYPNTLARVSSRHPSPRVSNRPVSYYWRGEAIRSRSVGEVVLADTLDVPAPPARLVADWQREMASRLNLEHGDVEALPLARARMRWPDYRRCVQAVADWVGKLGLEGVLPQSDIALMASRGARYHHDGTQYGGSAFCNLFLSEDKGLDLHFASTGLRIPLVRGTVVLFDTGQPHAVIARGKSGFDVADFPPERDCAQVFLTWELPIENAAISQALRVSFDVDPSTASRLEDEQLWVNGALASVCPNSGKWQGAEVAGSPLSQTSGPVPGHPGAQ